MPWGRTWSEELVAEWLELEGFLVTIGLKVRTGKGGGRKEADVVGARIRNINDMLAPYGVKFWDISDLIEKIEQSINSWVQTHKTPQNPYPSLPESYWMLQLFKVIATQQ
jgi:hypothetical protein